MTPAVLSVLLVEDDEVVRTSMRFALESERLQVLEAGSVAEGLAGFAAHPTQAAVIDLHLPDGTGYDLARALRGSHPRLPIVLISTDPEEVRDDFLTATRWRHARLLPKPFSARGLLDAIAQVVAARDAAGDG